MTFETDSDAEQMDDRIAERMIPTITRHDIEISTLETELYNLRRQNAELAAALTRNGHSWLCPAKMMGSENGPCSCGVENAQVISAAHDAKVILAFVDKWKGVCEGCGHGLIDIGVVNGFDNHAFTTGIPAVCARCAEEDWKREKAALVESLRERIKSEVVESRGAEYAIRAAAYRNFLRLIDDALSVHRKREEKS